VSRRWSVTAAGLVSAAGDTPAALLEALERGGPLAELHAVEGSATQVRAAPIAGFDPKSYIQRKGLKNLSRTSQLACAAAARVCDALADVPAAEIGVALGTAWGSLRTVMDFERAAHKDGPRLVDPLLFTETVSNVPAGQISIFYGWSAFNLTASAGAASGLEAIRCAIELLSQGRASAAVAGGADEINMRVLEALGGPGFAGGEGACLIAIEDPARASARGAPILGTILACAGEYAGDASGSSALSSADIAGFLRRLLDEAGLAPAEVDLVVLSAAGSGAVVREEAAALREVFGEDQNSPAAIAPKLVLGETWGASGPLGLVAALEVLRSASERRIRHALVFECGAAGHLSGLVAGAP
jgi:3-oxoacyl-[acyl-carrier-protein] synthase II